MAAGLAARRTELVRARLAAEEKAALEAIKSDLCQWLVRRDVLALETAPENFLEALDSGVHLCKLVGLIQEAAARRERLGKDTLVRVPPTRLACKSIKAARGSPMYLANARDNAAKFIGWCRELGVEEAIIFESVGLVEHSDERRVILCLLDVARFAAKVGISPPELVALEKEIDEMEAQQESERDRDGERNQSEEEEEDKTASVEVRESEEEEDEEEETAEERVREYKDQEDEEEETVEEREKGRVREYKEEDEEEETVEEREKGRVREYKDQEEEEETVEEMEKEAVPGDEEPPEKRVKQVLSLAETGTVSPSANNPTRHRRSVPRGKRKKKETVDSRVMQSVSECTCEHRIEVENFGKGKFTVSSGCSSPVKTSMISSGCSPPVKTSKTTIYARLLSDRVMVRVGGGWETLEHFLLKHDPCRIDNLPEQKTQATSKNPRKRAREL